MFFLLTLSVQLYYYTNVRTLKGVKIISTKKKSAKTNRVEVRLSDETLNDLNYCANELNTTKTNVIEQGIKKVKADIKK